MVELQFDAIGHQHRNMHEHRQEDEEDVSFIYIDSDVYNRGSLPLQKRRIKNVYCVNCGEKGHVVKECNGPITSFGIIAFKVVYESDEERYDVNDRIQTVLDLVTDDSKIFMPSFRQQSRNYPKIKFLMIQRKDTMGYIDFVRGKYPDNNEPLKQKLLQVCLSEMTEREKNNLLTKSFNTIWDELWVNHESKTYINEYKNAQEKFRKLNVKDLVENSTSSFKFQEFGFPKGRRNMKETNITCAEREFFEETGYNKSSYEFLKNYPTVQENFVGTNGIPYRHIYYVVKMKTDAPPPSVDASNKLQAGEVQNIGWFTYEQCMSLIRPYDTAKKNVIRQVQADLSCMNFRFECSDFYYNSRKKYRGDDPSFLPD